jgi:homoserine kinase
MGGLAIARMSSQDEAQVACIRPKGKWPLLLAIPEESLPTEKARGVLPENYSRADAVLNIQNSLFLLAAFMQGRTELLAPSLEDRIHQPYRAPLCPLLPILQELTGTPGILGAALSGAGPSVIVFLDPACAAQKTKKAIAAHLEQKKLPAELLLTSIALRGARG